MRHSRCAIEGKPDVGGYVLNRTLKLRPVTRDTHTTNGVTRNDGQRTFTRQLVGVVRVVFIRQLPCCRLTLWNDDDVCC